MIPRSLLAALLAATLSCSSPKETPTPAPDGTGSPPAPPASSAGAVAALSNSAAPQAVPEASPLRVIGKVTATHFYPVGHAMIACGVCYVMPTPPGLQDYAPSMWLITPDNVQEDATLWPIRAYFPKTLRDLVPDDGARVVFFGTYPNDVWAAVDYFVGRTPGSSEPVRRSGTVWVKNPKGPSQETFASLYYQDVIPKPPRAYDDAVVHAPWPGANDQLAYGAGAPPLLAGPKQLATWDGKRWTLREAPWASQASSKRLASGETLVVSAEGVFLVEKSGSIRAISSPPEADPNVKPPPGPMFKPIRFFRLEDDFVIVRQAKDESEILSAADPSALRLPKQEMREKTPEKPATAAEAPSASASPSAGASADSAPSTSATAAPQPNEMPPPVNFTAACKTPFVVLSTPPSLTWQNKSVSRALLGHGELQDDLSFVAFRRGSVVYFGAQTTSEDVARKVVEIVEQAKVGLKPQLSCLDATPRITDRYDPPEGMARVLLNLTTGEQLSLETGELRALGER